MHNYIFTFNTMYCSLPDALYLFPSIGKQPLHLTRLGVRLSQDTLHALGKTQMTVKLTDVMQNINEQLGK